VRPLDAGGRGALLVSELIAEASDLLRQILDLRVCTNVRIKSLSHTNAQRHTRTLARVHTQTCKCIHENSSMHIHEYAQIKVRTRIHTNVSYNMCLQYLHITKMPHAYTEAYTYVQKNTAYSYHANVACIYTYAWISTYLHRHSTSPHLVLDLADLRKDNSRLSVFVSRLRSLPFLPRPLGARPLLLCMCVYVCMFVYVCVCARVCMHVVHQCKRMCDVQAAHNVFAVHASKHARVCLIGICVHIRMRETEGGITRRICSKDDR